jgi:uncharacterized protein (TIGR02147 family)
LGFLQDSYEYLHSKDESLSYEKIAESCGFKSRTEARSLIKGGKKASEAHLRALATYFELSEDESRYLICLARFQELGATPAAYELFQRLTSMQQAKGFSKGPFREIEIATSVLHLTVLSALDLPNVPQEAAVISARLKGRYTPLEINQAIIELENHGFIHKEPLGNRWVLSQRHIKKYDYNANYFLKSFHAQCLDVAKESLNNEALSERYLVGASFCINGKIFSRIVQKMNAFVENLMQLEGIAGNPDTVVQFNQQLIRMTRTEDANNKERGLDGAAAERGLDSTENTVIA